MPMTTALAAAPALTSAASASERLYVLKWTDTSQGFHFPCERRDLTFERASAQAAKFAERKRLFYSGPMAFACPFENVRVAVQCDCGRDVTDPAVPHTVPYTRGEICRALDVEPVA